MPKVGIVMGSDSDLKVMSKAAATLEKFGIDYEMTIISAQMLAMSDPELLEKLKAYSAEMKETVQAKADRLAEVGYEEYLKEK